MQVELKSGQAPIYCYNEADLKQALGSLPRTGHGAPSVQRFKGLGEMMATQLWDTTLNPATR